MFRTVSQTLIDYRRSDLSEGEAGAVRGGDRLPWVAPGKGGGEDNFAPLASRDWQLHVYGEASPDLAASAAKRGLPLLSFPWNVGAGECGLARNAAYLVRPDGYVALADADAHPERLERYLDARGLS
jgi:hypothetical protein